jgi:D-beta-D-heptose 7-phosphate kinase/D-beta-D-heptose 1-phosphate adenosyltransferase
VVFTNGCFDVLHPGHVEHLAQAKALGDVLVVGLNSDASVRRLKGAGRPLVREADRAAVLAALRSVDAVTLFDEDTPLELISTLLPDVLVKGGDYDLDGIVGREAVEEAGGEVRVLPFVEGYSTTDILGRSKDTE